MKLNECLHRLRELNLRLRSQLELAEAQLPALNSSLRQLARLGLGSRAIVFGPVLWSGPYDPETGRSDSGQVVQSCLVMPDGLGIVLRDAVEDVLHDEGAVSHLEEVRRRFIPFDDCEPAVKALLLPVAGDLIRRVVELEPHDEHSGDEH